MPLLLKRRGVVSVLFVATIVGLLALGSRQWQFDFSSVRGEPRWQAALASASRNASFSDQWDFQRDRRNLLFTNEQCNQIFPDLYYDIDRAVKDRRGKRITLDEIDSIEPRNGYVRAMIYNQQVQSSFSSAF